MRVAVLADIHGNLPALEAVLRDVEAAGVDAVVLDGDLADGPGIEFITGNVRASASDAEALAAFNETIERQARRRPGPA
jgi:predicted phosphodiesterase